MSPTHKAANPFTVEIIRNALIKSADDMKATLRRTAYSPVIYEGVDLACAILRSDASMVAETAGIPAFLGNLTNVVQVLKQEIPEDRMRPEDVYFCNDPYDGGGTHANDVVAAYPVFCRGRLLAFCVLKAHVLDIGGIYAGGWYNGTTEIYQEGLRIPPVKLCARGESNEDLLRVIKANSRLPEPLVGDIRAMVGAVRTGGLRVVEIIDRFGIAAFDAAVEEILDHGEWMARSEIIKIPDGEYSSEFYLDGDGDQNRVLSERIRVHVRIEIDGDEITVDLSESDDESIGPMNAPMPTSISYVRFGFKAVTTPLLPNNEGCFRPLHVVLRRGSIFDPIPPAPVALWVEAAQNIPDLMMKALAPAIPDRVRASHFGSDLAAFTYGTNPATGRTYLMVEESVPGGWGGKPYADGESALHATAEGDTNNIPIEMVEVEYPLRVERYALVPDSAGPGRWRGGLGVEKIVSPIGHDCRLTASYDRTKYSAPWGLFGGRDGKQNMLATRTRDGELEKHPKVTDKAILAGESIVFRSGGGGGYGDPHERDPQLVLNDVIDGYVSQSSAEDDYGVVLRKGEAGEMTVDEAGTLRSRADTVASRKSKNAVSTEADRAT